MCGRETDVSRRRLIIFEIEPIEGCGRAPRIQALAYGAMRRHCRSGFPGLALTGRRRDREGSGTAVAVDGREADLVLPPGSAQSKPPHHHSSGGSTMPTAPAQSSVDLALSDRMFPGVGSFRRWPPPGNTLAAPDPRRLAEDGSVPLVLVGGSHRDHRTLGAADGVEGDDSQQEDAEQAAESPAFVRPVRAHVLARGRIRWPELSRICRETTPFVAASIERSTPDCVPARPSSARASRWGDEGRRCREEP